jgi:pimeloyl-ACP methyl ester carboxylesterase
MMSGSHGFDVLADDGDGVPLVYHHGTPGAAIRFEPMVTAARAVGLRLVTYSRPGYGDTAPRTGRSVADAAADTARILDELGADRFYTIGLSGGGPHALACAALLPDRCIAAATIGGVAPYDAEGLDFTAGMGPENIEEFGLAVQGREALIPFLEAQRDPMSRADAAGIIEALGGLLPAVDREALTGAVAEWMITSFHRAVENGIDGWLDDDLAFTRDWGFPLAGITVPVAIWQGGVDLMVPPAHGAWLADHLPTARPHLLADHGHLSLAVADLPRIIADLATLR